MISSTNLDRSLEVELASLMRKLKRDQVLQVPKMQLLELVGYQNDAAGAWARVKEAFEDVGGNPDRLHGKRLDSGEVLIVVGGVQPIDRF